MSSAFNGSSLYSDMMVTRNPISTYCIVRTSHVEAAGPKLDAPRAVRAPASADRRSPSARDGYISQKWLLRAFFGRFISMSRDPFVYRTDKMRRTINGFAHGTGNNFAVQWHFLPFFRAR
jgi:hypothetical protein